MSTTTPASATAHPRFRRDLGVEIGEDVTFLFDEMGVTALNGAEVAALAAALDGHRDLAALAAARPGDMTPGQVLAMVGRLEEAGLVVAAAPGEPARPADPVQAWWDACGTTGARVGGRAAVSAVGRAGGAAAVAAALAAGGTAVAPAGSWTDLQIVLCADYLDPALATIDADNRRAGTPWLLAKPGGVRLWIGPVFQPGTTGCWHCLAHRLWMHRTPEAIAQQMLGRDGPASRPPTSLAAGDGVAAHLVALEAVKWLGGHRYDGQHSVWVLDTRDLHGDHHRLRPRPQCPACGDPGMVAAAARRPVVLAPAPKAAGSGGGHRTVPPSEMLARHAGLVSPVTGIVKAVVRDPLAPPFAHAYRSGPNLSRRLNGVAALRRSVRAENGGKGLTALDAEVGALCEAAERHSATWQGDELRVRGSLRSLDGAAVDPRTCLLFAEHQHATRDAWNARHSAFNHVPVAFDPEAELDWTPLWSLTGQRSRLLPTAMLYFGAPPEPSLIADSNGNAAGSSLEDAVLQGLLELVERDAVALWWYNRSGVPGVNLAAFADPRLAEQQEHHARIGRELWALDITADLGVPVTVALSRRPGGPGGERILLGFGAHPDPEVAARRAVAEVNQILPADRGCPAASGDPDWTEWATHTVAGDPYLLPAPNVRPVDHPVVCRDDVRDEVSALVTTLAGAALEVLVLDQTRPDVGIPAVKVVVPGLRSFWSRFAPGRMFEVPVRLGRAASPTPCDRLNPVPLYM
jgi:oxazoline/thiazoline synthase